MKKINRRELKEKLKKYEKLTPSINKFIEDEHLVENSEAVIYIKVEDDVQWYNPFSCGKQLILNQDIIDYIDIKAYNIPAKYPLRLCFIGNFQEEDKKKIKELVHEQYFLKLQDKKIDLHRNLIKIVALFILGATFLLIWFGLESYEVGQLFSEIISIIGTFALWEVADFYLLERTEIKLEYAYAGHVATADVDFLNPSEASKYI